MAKIKNRLRDMYSDVLDRLDEHDDRLDGHDKRLTRSEKVSENQSREIEELKMRNRNLEIKLKLTNGEKSSVLQAEYGLSKSRISQIKNSN